MTLRLLFADETALLEWISGMCGLSNGADRDYNKAMLRNLCLLLLLVYAIRNFPFRIPLPHHSSAASTSLEAVSDISYWTRLVLR